MNERIGLLFEDGSILVLPEGTSIEAAEKEAEEHDAGDDRKTQVVSFVISCAKAIRDAG